MQCFLIRDLSLSLGGKLMFKKKARLEKKFHRDIGSIKFYSQYSLLDKKFQGQRVVFSFQQNDSWMSQNMEQKHKHLRQLPQTAQIKRKEKANATLWQDYTCETIVAGLSDS